MSPATGVRVFVVEDQVPLLKNLCKALALFEELIVVGDALTGEAALEQMRVLEPQVALVDLELAGGIDGVEVTRRLKRAGAQTEVLILTSFDDEQKVYEAMQAGAAGYLVKRVGPEKIRAAIHDVLAGGTVLEPLIAKRFWHYFHSLKTAAPPRDEWHLTADELEVLRFVAKGLTNAEVGKVMSIERRTVRTLLGHVYRKLGVSSHVDAVVLAVKAGLIDV